jgi:dipeptidyl aminopeptidase/acylaminoacyl peptidase
MREHLRFAVIVFCALVAVNSSSALSPDGAKRFSPDDLFRLEELSNEVISPDGNWVAYVLSRSQANATYHKQGFLEEDRQTDVWLVSTKGGQPVNLTNGASDGSGFWMPIWSPNSERLAVLSTRGGNVRPWVIERKSRRLQQLTDRGVNPYTRAVWLSNDVLACVVLPAGKRPSSVSFRMGYAEVVMREWPKAWEGEEITASVLDSGGVSGFENRPKGALIFVDVKGTTDFVAEGDFGDLSLSPDKHYLATVEAVDVVQPKPDSPLTPGLLREWHLAVFASGGVRMPTATKGLQLTGRMRWSPDSSRLALVGRIADKPSIYLFSAGAEGLKLVKGEDLSLWGAEDSIDFLLSEKNELIIRANRKAPGEGGERGRLDWWLLTNHGEARNLTAAMKAAPPELFIEGGHDSFVGTADGKLWRITLDGATPDDVLQKRAEEKIVAVVWSNSLNWCHQIVVSLQNGAEAGFLLVDLGSGRFERISKPEAEASLTFYDLERTRAIFKADTRSGTRLWVVDRDSPPRKVLETNTFLKGVAEGEVRKIEYKSLDGQPLNAWMILPPDYQTGMHYPMVVWVYAGYTVDEQASNLTKINCNHELNLQLLATQGYAVLLPSMPLPPVQEASDPYMELTKGVLPAVDRAIELGYADPQRLAVMGQSYGGYSTYGLVTQTNRFKAGIALAGLSDLISLYGIFLAPERYGEFPHENFLVPSILENGQLRMGIPPWKDWGRYLRNSPIFYVDRVQTPLMIVQGDMDWVSVTQGEEFFTALYRQGKRARFIRYWGEGHVLQSPANVRNYWYQAYAWLDEFLDVQRGLSGNLIFDGERLKSRSGAPPLKPDDFARFDERMNSYAH